MQRHPDQAQQAKGNPNIQLFSQTLETTSTNKYLGINISSDLSWSNHVEDVAARGNRTMGFMRRNFRECKPKVKTATYTTLVRPTLEYASAVWDPYKQKDAQLLENVQRRAARYMNNYTDRSPGSVTSMLDKSGTSKTTDPPGDALQNQQRPRRHQPRKFLPAC